MIRLPVSLGEVDFYGLLLLYVVVVVFGAAVIFILDTVIEAVKTHNQPKE